MSTELHIMPPCQDVMFDLKLLQHGTPVVDNLGFYDKIKLVVDNSSTITVRSDYSLGAS